MSDLCVAMMPAQASQPLGAVVTSDASRVWGCGAYFDGRWFSLPWSPRYRDCHITVKELAPIVIAAIVWQVEWRNKSVLAHCDNSAEVAIVN